MFFIWILLNKSTTKKGVWLNMLDKYRRTSWKNGQNVQQTSVEKASKDPKVLKNVHKNGMVARKESGNIYSCKKIMEASRNMYGKMLTKTLNMKIMDKNKWKSIQTYSKESENDWKCWSFFLPPEMLWGPKLGVSPKSNNEMHKS